MIEEIRVKEWLDKLVLVLAASYMAAGPVIELLYLSVYLVLLYSYGYLLNSYCDRDAKLFRSTKSLLLALAVLLMVMPLLAMNSCAFFVGLLTFLLATLYSMPPVRLKARSFLGLSAALAQYPLPFALFECVTRSINYAVIAYLLLLGVIKLMVHQLEDYDADRKAEIRTMAVAAGKKPMKIWALTLLLLLIMLLFFIEGQWLLIIASFPSFAYMLKVLKDDA